MRNLWSAEGLYKDSCNYISTSQHDKWPRLMLYSAKSEWTRNNEVFTVTNDYKLDLLISK